MQLSRKISQLATQAVENSLHVYLYGLSEQNFNEITKSLIAEFNTKCIYLEFENRFEKLGRVEESLVQSNVLIIGTLAKWPELTWLLGFEQAIIIDFTKLCLRDNLSRLSFLPLSLLLRKVARGARNGQRYKLLLRANEVEQWRKWKETYGLERLVLYRDQETIERSDDTSRIVYAPHVSVFLLSNVMNLSIVTSDFTLYLKKLRCNLNRIFSF